MTATNFEFRHQALLHLLIAGCALLTYTVNSDDIVWALVRDHASRRMLERFVFGIGSLFALGSAALEMRVTASRTLLAARLLFALGLGLLLPLPGTVVLIGGELVLVGRLLLRDRGNDPTPQSQMLKRAWRDGLRASASKWGVAFALVVLCLTLQDRAAEITAGLGLLISLLMNAERWFAPAPVQ